MLKNLLPLLLLAATTFCFALSPDFATDPAISPDGSEVCFVYENDLWLVPYSGGEARRLTSTEANEWGPCWSPDGQWIAFNSNREGLSYPYLISVKDGSTRLVYAEAFTVSDWFADGQSLLCTKYNQQFGSSFYQVPLSGSRPQLLAEIGDRYASLSPDNLTIVFNRNGNPHREAYRGSIAGELWSIDIATKKYTQLTFTDYTERYPRFSHAKIKPGTTYLYYCASDGERFQIYRVNAAGKDFSRPEQLTNFMTWSARDISIARHNDNLVFEFFNEIWTLTPGGKAAKLDIQINADFWQYDRIRDNPNFGLETFAVSDDELLVAFMYGFDTFFMPRKGGDARRVTWDQSTVGHMEFLEDNRTLLLTQMEKGKNRLYTVTCDSTMAVAPVDWVGRDSLDIENFYRDPSGKWVIYYGDNRLSGRIAIADSALQNIRILQVPRPVTSNFAINSTGDYAVYATTREDVWTRELWVYDFARDEHRKLINDDSWIRSLAWSRDDRSILMSRSGGIFRLDLVPRDELEYETDNWEEIFKPITAKVTQDSDDADKAGDEEVESDEIQELTIDLDEPSPDDSIVVEKVETLPAPRPELKIVWPGLDKRLFLVLTEANRYLTVQRAIDDSTFYYLSEAYGENATARLKKANIYGQNSKNEADLGSYSGNLRWVGDSVYYLRDGKIAYYSLKRGNIREVGAKVDYDFSVSLLNRKVFEQVWGVFGLNFYDPQMHGRNWTEVYELYRPYADKARSIDDIATIVNEMIGDVNASHTGFYPRRYGMRPNRQIAALGVEFDYATRLQEGIKVTAVYPTGRLATVYNIQPGFILSHIDGQAITQQTPVDSLLVDKIGKRIKLRFINEGEVTEAQLTGLTWSQNRQLYYTHKVNLSRKTVDEMTNNRIGYLHIPAMGSRDYDNFQRELFREFADKEALIIDVRGNTGGHVHDQIINILARQPYAYSTSRRYSGDKVQEPRRAWTRPTIVLVDEGSFSDGEIFPTIYQELKLGKVVGMPSSGSVIGTWEYKLLDGSGMRLPGSGWYRLDGTNMEGTGAQPDIVVPLLPEDEIAGRDTQLLRAIEEILKELP